MLDEVLPARYGIAGLTIVVVAVQCLRLAIYTVWLRDYAIIGSNISEWISFVVRLIAVISVAIAAGKLVLCSVGESPLILSAAACACDFFVTSILGLWVAQLTPFEKEILGTRWPRRTLRP
jgi:hypothetical protein